MWPTDMTADTFSKQTRVRLVFVLNELFPPAQYEWMGDGLVGGDEQRELERLLRKKLGAFEIGGGDTPAGRLKAFITTARDEDLLAATGLFPEAQFLGDKSMPAIPPMADREISRRVDRVVARMNAFFEEERLPARFDGLNLSPTGGVDTTPKTLSDLPKQDNFKADVANRLSNAQEPTAFIFIDLDNFKAVNDRVSHLAGDNCLAAVVDAVGGAIRGKGKLYRYGGDEFAVILPNFVIAEAAAVAERIRSAVDASGAGGVVSVTASIGVIASDQALNGHDTLLDMLDECTYVSKVEGKNRVTAWPVEADVLARVRSVRAQSKARD
jgi:diguanylate cyclase (GGDEF)-like protein